MKIIHLVPFYCARSRQGFGYLAAIPSRYAINARVNAAGEINACKASYFSASVRQKGLRSHVAATKFPEPLTVMERSPLRAFAVCRVINS
jgi:hypothetical protein